MLIYKCIEACRSDYNLNVVTKKYVVHCWFKTCSLFRQCTYFVFFYDSQQNMTISQTTLADSCVWWEKGKKFYYVILTFIKR